jgi:hypothetical protein
MAAANESALSINTVRVGIELPSTSITVTTI